MCEWQSVVTVGMRVAVALSAWLVILLGRTGRHWEALLPAAELGLSACCPCAQASVSQSDSVEHSFRLTI